MASLKETLLKYAETSAPFASEERIETEERPKSTFDKDAFLREIKDIRKKNEIYFYICIAMAVCLFVVSIVVVVNNLDESAIVKVAMGGFGITSAGLLTWTFKALRTKNVIEVLISMAPQVNDDLLKLIIETLARRL